MNLLQDKWNKLATWAKEQQPQLEEKLTPLTNWIKDQRPKSTGERPKVALPTEVTQGDGGTGHLMLAEQSLRELLQAHEIPPRVRASLTNEYRQVEMLLQKVREGHIYMTAFGRVGVGKSATLNALIGEKTFSVSPLHGETTDVGRAAWNAMALDGVFLIDTPGIDEVAGEDRERIAREAAQRSDLILFITDGDLTESEFQALKSIHEAHQAPLILILNKADWFTPSERDMLLRVLTERTTGLVKPEYILACSANPRERIYIEVDADGQEIETTRQPPPDLGNLREILKEILETEGKTLAALNAGILAGRISDQVAARITQLNRETAEGVIHAYCLGKGVAVAFNPVPIADLLTVAADAAMVVSLSRVYGLPISTAEAGGLMKTILAQMALLMGTVWGINLASSALKGVSMGLSTVVTAGTQGAVAYYATYVVGRAAEQYFAQGRSWGNVGPRQTVRDILDSLDRESILAQARQEILERVRFSEG